jgi:hypothetical protein
MTRLLLLHVMVQLSVKRSQRFAQDDYSTISYDSDIPNDMIDDAMNPNISSCGGMNFHLIDAAIQDIVSQSQSNDDDEYPMEGTCCGKKFYFLDEDLEEVEMVESCLYPMMEGDEMSRASFIIPDEMINAEHFLSIKNV